MIRNRLDLTQAALESDLGAFGISHEVGASFITGILQLPVFMEEIKSQIHKLQTTPMEVLRENPDGLAMNETLANIIVDALDADDRFNDVQRIALLQKALATVTKGIVDVGAKHSHQTKVILANADELPPGLMEILPEILKTIGNIKKQNKETPPDKVSQN